MEAPLGVFDGKAYLQVPQRIDLSPAMANDKGPSTSQDLVPNCPESVEVPSNADPSEHVPVQESVRLGIAISIVPALQTSEK
jgi:hypothetical protein